MRQTSVRFEVHSPAPLLQLVGSHLAPSVSDNGIRVTMAHEDGRVLVGGVGRYHVPNLVLQQKVAGQAEDTTKLGRACNAGHQTHGTTLAEATKNDALGWDSSVDFGLDQCVEDFLRAQHTGFVFRTVGEVAEVGNIVPSGHAHAHVHSDRDARCIGEDEFGIREFTLCPPLLREE